MDANQFKIFLDETKIHLEKVVKETVNGKIDNLHKEVVRLDGEQDKKIQEVVKNTKDIVDIYRTSSKIGSAIITLAKFLTAIATVAGLGWAFTKFVVLQAIK